MQLHYELVSFHELTDLERVFVTYNREEFCFIRSNGILKINKTLPRPKTLAKIAANLWQHDRLQDEAESWEIDAIYNRVREIAGKEAALQLYGAWNEAVREKLNAENKRDASEWLQYHDIPGELDAISGASDSYRPGFIEALWGLTKSTDAIFLYGYQAGMEASRKVAN